MADGSHLADILGAVAGTLTTVAFLPQVVKTWRGGSTRDISLTMFLVFCIGVGLWLVYGLLLGAWPVIIANLFTLALAGVILWLKLRNVLRGQDRD